MKYVVWTLLVWIPVVVLAWLVSDPACSHTDLGCIGPSPDAVMGFLVVAGFLVYLVGLLVIRWWHRPSGPPSR